MDNETKGALRLRELFKPTLTQKDLADRLGVTQQAIPQWIKGTSKPDPLCRKKLERVLGIPEEAWLTDDELAAIAKLAPLEPTGSDA